MCSVCHSEQPINGVQLECSHIFCYLCIKSAAETTGRCPTCRTEIGLEFNYQQHNIIGIQKIPHSRDGQYWFYEGFRGWWLYDADTHSKIEATFREGSTSLEQFIAGYFYVIDLEKMEQRRKDGFGRARKICRSDLKLDNIIGMAGLKGADFDETLKMMQCAQEMR